MAIEKASPGATSVIITTHDRAHLVGRAIRSVLAQSATPREIIVVDDASTDSTREVVEQFDSDLVQCHSQPVCRGAPAARNLGIRLATRPEL